MHLQIIYYGSFIHASYATYIFSDLYTHLFVDKDTLIEKHNILNVLGMLERTLEKKGMSMKCLII